MKHTIKEVFRLPKQNIFEMIYPFIFILKISCCSFTSIKGELTDGTIEVTRYDKTRMLIYLLVNGFVLYRNCITQHTTRFPLLNFGNRAILIVCSILSISVIFLWTYNRHKYWKSIRILYQFDLAVRIKLLTIYRLYSQSN